MMRAGVLPGHPGCLQKSSTKPQCTFTCSGSSFKDTPSLSDVLFLEKSKYTSLFVPLIQ